MSIVTISGWHWNTSQAVPGRSPGAEVIEVRGTAAPALLKHGAGDGRRIVRFCII